MPGQSIEEISAAYRAEMLAETSANRFADYVTSQAFALHLSRPMIASLVYTYHAAHDLSMPFPNNGLGSWSALERRGLIERSWTHGPNGGRKHRVKCTEAGKLVYKLCELAGLITDERNQDGVAK